MVHGPKRRPRLASFDCCSMLDRRASCRLHDNSRRHNRDGAFVLPPLPQTAHHRPARALTLLPQMSLVPSDEVDAIVLAWHRCAPVREVVHFRHCMVQLRVQNARRLLSMRQPRVAAPVLILPCPCSRHAVLPPVAGAHALVAIPMPSTSTSSSTSCS